MKEVNFDDFYYKGKKYSLSEQRLIYRKSYAKSESSRAATYLESVFYFSLNDYPNKFIRMKVDFEKGLLLKQDIVESIKKNRRVINKDNFIQKEFLMCPYLLLAFIKDCSESNIFVCEKYTIEKEEVISFYEQSHNEYMNNSLATLVSNNDAIDFQRNLEQWLISYSELCLLGE